MPGVKMNGLFQEKDEGPSKGGIEACSSDELYDDVGAPASVYEDVSSLERVNSIYESTTPMNDDWVTDEESESPAPTSAPRRLPKGRRTRRARTASRLSSRAARISTTRICKGTLLVFFSLLGIIICRSIEFTQKYSIRV